MTDFWIALLSENYDRDLGWPCSALTLPGAELVDLRINGEQAAPERYVADVAHVRLLVVPEKIPNARAKIRLKKRLVTIDSTIVVALIGLAGTLAGVLIRPDPAPAPNCRPDEPCSPMSEEPGALPARCSDSPESTHQSDVDTKACAAGFAGLVYPNTRPDARRVYWHVCRADIRVDCVCNGALSKAPNNVPSSLPQKAGAVPTEVQGGASGSQAVEAPPTTYSSVSVGFHTETDDKDSEESVSIELVSAASLVGKGGPWGGGEIWGDQEDRYNGEWHNFDVSLASPLTEPELKKLRLRVIKSQAGGDGGKGWEFKVRVIATSAEILPPRFVGLGKGRAAEITIDL